MKYDIVVNVGCSYMNNDAILDANNKPIKEYISSLLLSKKLECDFINLAGSGFSNERIMRVLYEWVEDNNKTGYYENPLIVIGLSGTSRYHFQNIETKQYWDLQPEKLNSYDDKALDGINNKLTQKLDTLKNLRFWMKYYMKWLYNEEHEYKKLQREIVFLHHYLIGNNCDYRIFNSLQDSLGDIKNKINYISFQDDKYKGDDTWYQYLKWQMKYIDNEDFNQNEKYRKPIPPYGKRFCDGHPSPNANKELCERILEELK